MRFLLTSAGVRNTTIHDALLDLLGDPSRTAPRCAFRLRCTAIPMAVRASAGSSSAGSSEQPMTELGWKSVGLIELTALPSIDEERWVPSYAEADVLLVSGGDALYLCHWMRECGLTDLLPSLRRHGVGRHERREHGDDAAYRQRSSSGGSRPPATTARSAWSTSRSSLTWTTSCCPTTRWPRQRHGLPDLDCPAYAIDDETAIRVIDGAVDVVSEGQWRLFTPNA